MLTGKTKEQCTLALRAAQGNPDVAYEILSSGMPLNAGMGGEGDEGMEDDYGDEDPSVGGGAPGGGANLLAAIADNPNFPLIR